MKQLTAEHQAQLPNDTELPIEYQHVIRPIVGDIVLDKVAPNQAVKLDIFAHKGIGMDHAKFSPVSVATYRLLPTIELKDKNGVAQVFEGDDAALLQSCFTKGVIELQGANKRAVVVNARDDMISREVFRYPQFEGRV